MPEKLISELLILPEKVHKGDFVLNLSRGVTEPEKTLYENGRGSRRASRSRRSFGTTLRPIAALPR